MEALKHLVPQLHTFGSELFKMFLMFLLLTLIFSPLEYFFGVRSQKFLRKAWFTDLGYYFINGVFTKSLVAFVMTWIALAITHYLPAEIRNWGHTLPLAARLTVTMIVGEIGYYWGHRWMHEIPYLWRIHAIHHSAPELDWLVSTRAHPLDMVLPRACGFVLMFSLGLVEPLSKTGDLALILILLIGSLLGFFVHANLRWRFGWLEWLIATPAFHHWHHTNDGLEYINKNYSPTLPWVDLIFGTFYLPKQWPKLYGISAAMPTNLAAQLLEPFSLTKPNPN
jgi:sterol desaturase/sphingolipid hydroxylase (fatty acid hydroxylase superfamily)